MRDPPGHDDVTQELRYGVESGGLQTAGKDLVLVGRKADRTEQVSCLFAHLYLSIFARFRTQGRRVFFFFFAEFPSPRGFADGLRKEVRGSTSATLEWTPFVKPIVERKQDSGL